MGTVWGGRAEHKTSFCWQTCRTFHGVGAKLALDWRPCAQARGRISPARVHWAILGRLYRKHLALDLQLRWTYATCAGSLHAPSDYNVRSIGPKPRCRLQAFAPPIFCSLALMTFLRFFTYRCPRLPKNWQSLSKKDCATTAGIRMRAEPGNPASPLTYREQRWPESFPNKLNSPGPSPNRLLRHSDRIRSARLGR